MAMWEDDWALLGIEPTTKLGAIKKAYALKLKVTRPDDDAQAYQALRDAYERVQQWVRLHRDAPPEVAEQADIATAAAPLDQATDAADQIVVESASPAATTHTEASEDGVSCYASPPDAQALTGALQTAWDEGGAVALALQWPQARTQLHEQPLAHRAQLSAQFAHWVLAHPALPDAVVMELAMHFEWLGDFRVERQIGPELTQALHATLHERVTVATPPSPEVLAQAQPLLQFKRLQQQERHLLSLVLSLALQPMLAGLMQVLGLRTMGQLGLDKDDLRHLRHLSDQAFVCRLILLAAAAFLFFVPRLAFFPDAVDRWMFWLVAAGLLLGATHYLGLMMTRGLSITRPGRTPLALPLMRWRRSRWQPLLGLGLLMLAAALGVLAGWTTGLPTPPIESQQQLRGLVDGALSISPWLLTLAAALLAWPLSTANGALCVGLVLPLTTLLCMKAGDDGMAWSACQAVALLYVLTGAALHEQRLHLHDLLAWIFRPVTNTLVLGATGGWWFGMMPTLLALAHAMSLGAQATAYSTVMVWLLATLALGFGQQRLESWAMARLRRA